MFRTPQQAQTAIEKFNGSTWNGHELSVGLGKRPTGSGASTVTSGRPLIDWCGEEDRQEMGEVPLIVNGSGPNSSRRLSHADSDDESDEVMSSILDLDPSSRLSRDAHSIAHKF
jgi:hypothetical protein